MPLLYIILHDEKSQPYTIFHSKHYSYTMFVCLVNSCFIDLSPNLGILLTKESCSSQEPVIQRMSFVDVLHICFSLIFCT